MQIPIYHLPNPIDPCLPTDGTIDRGLLAHLVDEGLVDGDLLVSIHNGGMIYLSPQASNLNADGRPTNFGHLLTPMSKQAAPSYGRYWAADCDILSGRYAWPRYYAWLGQMLDYQQSCLFVVCPDVVERTPAGFARGNATATRDRFRYLAWRIKEMGYPVAYVAQDGQEDLPWPADDAWDVLFVGGSTDWKLGEGGAACIEHAHKLDKWIHVGRVNSASRLAQCQMLGADSADGTTIAHAPEEGYRILGHQLSQLPMRFR